MRLSIIIPTFNEEEHLPRLLKSIESQTFKDLEVIIADAHSDDSTREIAEGFGAKIVDGGLPGPGRNRGADAASGGLLLFLDADVVFPSKGWLKKKLGQFDMRELDCGTCLVKPMSKKVIDKLSHGVFNAHMFALQLLKAHAPGFCIFITRKLHNEIHGFDEKIRLAEDHDYVFRASRIGRFRVMIGAGIKVSVRRFERDGRAEIFKKYLLAELHLLTKGKIDHDRFDYTFGYGTTEQDTSRDTL